MMSSLNLLCWIGGAHHMCPGCPSHFIFMNSKTFPTHKETDRKGCCILVTANLLLSDILRTDKDLDLRQSVPDPPECEQFIKYDEI